MQSSNISNSIHKPYTGNVDDFHEWLMDQPRLKKFPERVWNLIFHALRFSEKVHVADVRKEENMPYINHLLRVVSSLLKGNQKIYTSDIITLTLHDAIEDHPECWWEVLAQFGIHVFRDVLMLSKIDISMRKEILSFLVKEGKIQNDKNCPIGDIFQILAPNDPLEKLELFSEYSEKDVMTHFDHQLIHHALILYKLKIIEPKKNDPMNDSEYISLGNYLYYRKKDAERKLRDMLDNMQRMSEMENMKPGYIEKRRIKAYILGVKLRWLGMQSEFAELQQTFHNAGYTMYTDSQVVAILQNAGSLSEHH